MKPYGNEHSFKGPDDLNSSKHGKLSSKNRVTSRRAYKKTTRATAKRDLAKSI